MGMAAEVFGEAAPGAGCCVEVSASPLRPTWLFLRNSPWPREEPCRPAVHALVGRHTHSEGLSSFLSNDEPGLARPSPHPHYFRAREPSGGMGTYGWAGDRGATSNLSQEQAWDGPPDCEGLTFSLKQERLQPGQACGPAVHFGAGRGSSAPRWSGYSAPD